MAQHDFEYVSKREYMPVKKELVKLINDVQKELKDKFTFQFYFIGSTSRNMITRDKMSNQGYDFDVDIYPNVYYEDYNPKRLREIIIDALNKNVSHYGYSSCENSTRVITIKVKDKKNSKILHSCDMAICFDFEDGDCQYIHFNKNQNTFEWQKRPDPSDVEEKAYWLKEETDTGWSEVKDLYLYLKDNNDNPNKRSRSLYSEAVSSIYNEYNMN